MKDEEALRLIGEYEARRPPCNWNEEWVIAGRALREKVEREKAKEPMATHCDHCKLPIAMSPNPTTIEWFATSPTTYYHPQCAFMVGEKAKEPEWVSLESLIAWAEKRHHEIGCWNPETSEFEGMSGVLRTLKLLREEGGRLLRQDLVTAHECVALLRKLGCCAP